MPCNDATVESWSGHVIILRTNSFSSSEGYFASQLSSDPDFRFVVVADERDGNIDCQEYTKLVLDENLIEEMNLVYEHDTPWRCGDYAFYVARRRFPLASHFWIIEPDVHMNCSDPISILSEFNDYAEVDLIAPCYGPAKSKWVWYGSMKRFHTTVYSMFFPVVRLSGRAVDHLLKRRIYSSTIYAQIGKAGGMLSDAIWPNDEAFVATELANAGFNCRDMNSFERQFYDRDSLSATKPIVKSMIPEDEDRLIRHPYLPLLKTYTKTEAYVRGIKQRGSKWTESEVSYARKMLKQMREEHPWWIEQFTNLLDECGWND